MSSMFSAEEFLNLEVEGQNSTQSVPVPAGEYIAVIDEVKARQWKSKDDPTKQGMAVDITWLIDDANVKALLERDRVTVKQGVMLDLNDNGGIDTGKGKNVTLGRLREATDLNQPGRPFSFNQLKGKVAKVQIAHRIDGDAIYTDVKAVAKIA